jgi:5-methyltetrahydrofolate--homocysteine methyltransferase
MLQASDATLEDFDGHEGCNEILNVTRPDIVRAVHDGYLEAGVDCVTTNTFGANLSNLGEYGLSARIAELSQAGARIAREAADQWSTPERPRWVLGTMGPGTKLPTLGHARFADLRDAYQLGAAGLISGATDAIIIENSQDLLQAKDAIIGARRAMTAAGAQLPLIAQVTIETTGAMLLGSEIGAALTALEPLGITLIGLNCATGPGEMSEHLRYLAGHSRIPLSCMPNAGLPVLTSDGARYPLTPAQLADAHAMFTEQFGLALVGGVAPHPSTWPPWGSGWLEGRWHRAGPAEPVASRQQRPVPAGCVLPVSGERTNANGSRRSGTLIEPLQNCVEIARAQTRDGAHLLDLCVDYVGGTASRPWPRWPGGGTAATRRW